MSADNHKSFDNDLEQVRHKVILMAEMVCKELSDSIQAFSTRDQESASDTVAADTLVNASERIIDDQIIESISQHHPVTSDCRQLIAALRIAKDLERIGDYATNIANHSMTLDQLDITGEEQRVIDMGHAVTTMLEEVIEAFTEQDAAKSELVRQQDEQIDELFTKIFSELLTINSNNAKLSSSCTHLSFIARSLERIGDHITDIAEEILYTVEGKFPQDKRITADETAFLK
ncbi:MAG: phosphate signaling complex protein PhoU [Gammaproteobacteria bacterium]|nr:phosphate signaling complex protein PhoU [Gammaproteobacteria bacterium]